VATGTVALTSPVAGGWGILGGTFDPVHYAHLAIAEQTRETLDLAGVLFVPARTSPHKLDRPVTPAEDRVEMVRLAIADNPAFAWSRVEVDRPGVSYTVDTLELLRRERPETRWVLILSVEALMAFPEWHEPSRILDLVHVAVVPRRGSATPDPRWLEQHLPGRERRFIFLDRPDLGHSASAIRALVADGRSIRYLVPPAVEDHIRRQRLYRPPAVVAAAKGGLSGT
jgi:nicotinate-nucleotide adenylyltransferase